MPTACLRRNTGVQRTCPCSPLRGEVLYILHRVEDVTELVRASERGDALQGRTRAMENEVIQRSNELAGALQELRAANLSSPNSMSPRRRSSAISATSSAPPLTLMLGPLEDELAHRLRRGGWLPQPCGSSPYNRNALRLLKLVNTLLDFSRIEADRVNLNCEPVTWPH